MPNRHIEFIKNKGLSRKETTHHRYHELETPLICQLPN